MSKFKVVISNFGMTLFNNGTKEMLLLLNPPYNELIILSSTKVYCMECIINEECTKLCTKYYEDINSGNDIFCDMSELDYYPIKKFQFSLFIHSYLRINTLSQTS